MRRENRELMSSCSKRGTMQISRRIKSRDISMEAIAKEERSAMEMDSCKIVNSQVRCRAPILTIKGVH